MLHKLFLALTYCLILFSLQAQQKNTTSGEYLFNGKDLTGRKPLNGHAKFKVVNKELVGTTVLNEPAAKGHLLLQDHGNAVPFRSIKIKALK